MKLSAELQKSITEFLIALPDMDEAKSQKAFVYSASLDRELQDQIQFGDSPVHFIPLLISKAISYGTLRDGRDALESILKTSKNYIGCEKQEQCERLLHELSKQKRAISLQNSGKRVKRKAIASIATTLILMIGIFLYFRGYSEELKPFEEGIFGILVANFEGGTKDETTKGKQIQHTIESKLNARFHELSLDNAQAKVIPTSIVPSFNSHAEARKFGEKYNAELVIWGDVDMQGIIPNRV